MRKTLLASAITGALVTPLIGTLAHADVYDARSLARGGTGMTMGEYNQALHNPAMLNRFDDNDDFSFAVNVGVIASDKDGFIDAAEDIQDEIDSLGVGGSSATANDVDSRLKSLDSKLIQADAGIALMAAIPNNTVPMALVVKGKSSIGTSLSYDPSDLTTLQAIENNTPGGV